MTRARDASMQKGNRRGYSLWFVVIAALFATALITANISASKLVSIGGLILPAGTVVFPISYILGDVLTEVYGYREARRVIWLGFACNIIAVLAISAATALPSAPFWPHQSAYELILGQTPRFLGASLLAYLVGEFSNAYVLARLKVATRGRWLWIRTIGSTIVGEGLDSLVFMTAAFIGTIASGNLLQAAITQWLSKSAYEALATPVTYLVIGFLKREEGLDAYDGGTDLSTLNATAVEARETESLRIE